MFAPLVKLMAHLLFEGDWNLLRIRIETLIAQKRLAVPILVQQMLISGEDHRHRHHHGYDLRAIARALRNRLTRRSREGASTIEHRLVRVLTKQYEVTFKRKVREILLASLIEDVAPKRLVPDLYMQVAYFGSGMDGYSEACCHLSINAQSPTIVQAASLVARLKYPEPMQTSIRRLEQIAQRTNYLIKRYSVHAREGLHEHLSHGSIDLGLSTNSLEHVTS